MLLLLLLLLGYHNGSQVRMHTYENIEGNGVFDSGHSVSDVQHVQKTTADRHSRHLLSTINNAARNRKIMVLSMLESCYACLSAHAVKLLIIEHFTDGASDATWILLVIVVI